LASGIAEADARYRSSAVVRKLRSVSERPLSLLRAEAAAVRPTRTTRTGCATNREMLKLGENARGTRTIEVAEQAIEPVVAVQTATLQCLIRDDSGRDARRLERVGPGGARRPALRSTACRPCC